MKSKIQHIIILCCLFSLDSFVGYSQITVTNSTFPTPGDTLFTVIDANPSINNGSAGADMTWNFSSLNGPFVREQIFLEIEEGSAPENFPDATMVSFSTNEQEVYYQSFNNRILEIGFAGEFIPGFDVPALYTDPPTYRRAPISYLDSNDDDSSLSITVGADLVPEELLMGLPIDSFRITLETDSESIVDAYGTVLLPDSEHEVLRIKETTNSNTRLFVRSILGWTEVEGDLLASLGDIAAFFGTMESTTYHYQSNDSKTPIASVTVDENDNPASVEYMSKNVISGIESIDHKISDVIAYPNPSFGNLSIQMINYPIDTYRMEVYNIVGKKLWEQTFDLKPSRIQKIDLTTLRKGTYLYSVFDKNGKKLVTKRIAIISL